MRCALFASLVSICGAHLSPLKWMARNAAWGAANDKKYGKTPGEWDAHEARHAYHLDALNQALGEAPVVKYLDLMMSSAAWGAANERAYGKMRSGSQVDWDMFHEHKATISRMVHAEDRDFVNYLAEAAKNAAWYAANKYNYGESHAHTMTDLQDFKNSIDAAMRLAPKDWPINEVKNVFKFAALAVAAHRITSTNKEHKFMYQSGAEREDWKNYHVSAVDLRKELGSEQKILFEQLEGMVIESAWGAACERTHGKHSNDAKVHWRKYEVHSSLAKAYYQGTASWDHITQMITSAAWGAANERAYGQSNQDAQRNWQDWENAAAKISG